MRLTGTGRAAVVAAALGLAVSAGPARADSVANAQSACQVIDGVFEGIGRFDRKCEVRPAQTAVSAYIDLDQAKAAELCVAMAKLLRDQKVRFDRGWTLNIFTPRQTSAPLAICRL